jgi:hypothetical protein
VRFVWALGRAEMPEPFRDVHRAPNPARYFRLARDRLAEPRRLCLLNRQALNAASVIGCLGAAT